MLVIQYFQKTTNIYTSFHAKKLLKFIVIEYYLIMKLFITLIITIRQIVFSMGLKFISSINIFFGYHRIVNFLLLLGIRIYQVEVEGNLTLIDTISLEELNK